MDPGLRYGILAGTFCACSRIRSTLNCFARTRSAMSWWPGRTRVRSSLSSGLEEDLRPLSSESNESTENENVFWGLVLTTSGLLEGDLDEEELLLVWNLEDIVGGEVVLGYCSIVGEVFGSLPWSEPFGELSCMVCCLHES